MYNIISEETYPDGTIIVEEGSSGDWIYTILSGTVEIFKIVNGRKVVVDVLDEGDLIGETGFLTPLKRTASARAVGEVRVGVIDRDYLDDEFNKLSGDFKNILITLATRLTKTTEEVCNFIDTHRDHRLTLGLNIAFKNRESFVKAKLDNISSRGFFVLTNEPLDQGEQFLFKLEIPGTPDPIKGACDVIWSRRSSESPKTRPNGMGCKFIKMSRKDKAALKTFLGQLAQGESIFLSRA